MARTWLKRLFSRKSNSTRDNPRPYGYAANLKTLSHEAITWDTKITVRNLSQRQVSVTATRIDGADPTNPIVVSVAQATINTNAQKQHVIDTLWALYQAKLIENAQVNTVITTLENDANAALSALEP